MQYKPLGLTFLDGRTTFGGLVCERHEDPLDPDCSDPVDLTTSKMDWPTFASEIHTFQSLQDNFGTAKLFHIF